MAGQLKKISCVRCGSKTIFEHRGGVKNIIQIS